MTLNSDGAGRGVGSVEGWGSWGDGEHAERQPIMGVLGRSPQRGPGAEPLVGGEGAKPP